MRSNKMYLHGALECYPIKSMIKIQKNDICTNSQWRYQQWMYDAETAGMREDIERLFVYKESNHIISEEFIYMLSSISIMYDYTCQAEALMKELKKSSADGKKTARILEAEMDQYNNIMDFEDDWTDDELEDFMLQQEIKKREPYVKTEPEIGRNDPCPCGSGKKYKKCCGRNL